MGQKSRLQRVLRAPANDQRMQAVLAVELVVLQRVDHVETDQPKHDGRRQYDRQKGALLQDQPAIFDWEKVEGSFDREPRAQRRQGQSQTEENVREIREAFGQRIKADTKQRNRRKVKTDSVDEVTRDDESETAQQTKRPRARQRDFS